MFWYVFESRIQGFDLMMMKLHYSHALLLLQLRITESHIDISMEIVIYNFYESNFGFIFKGFDIIITTKHVIVLN